MPVNTPPPRAGSTTHTKVASERGGGRSEPESFRLEALVQGDKEIIVDFTPKGGPDNFKGVYEKKEDGTEGIRFVRDKNFWPKSGACEESVVQ